MTQDITVSPATIYQNKKGKKKILLPLSPLFSFVWLVERNKGKKKEGGGCCFGRKGKNGGFAVEYLETSNRIVALLWALQHRSQHRKRLQQHGTATGNTAATRCSSFLFLPFFFLLPLFLLFSLFRFPLLTLSILPFTQKKFGSKGLSWSFFYFIKR